MISPEQRRRIVNRVIFQYPFDERPGLWIYLLWFCLSTRTNNRNQPDFIATEIETGYSSDFIQQGFQELSDYGRTVLAAIQSAVEELEHVNRLNNRLSPIEEDPNEE
ncbi:Uncharacterized protein PECH_000433 [Penicillium ucsense]|uniref:Uncharacterized protein n=1 Tax=Penicillium ucsense TaxID=2839758 RepID=A0A8J8VZ56_9EURO|nr:Uncharacterized protein PECM_008481 [Penicillium ucsense]KAF7733591.1 Uncharacterized protein PECH_000433 [Penicillium ucsense]